MRSLNLGLLRIGVLLLVAGMLPLDGTAWAAEQRESPRRVIHTSDPGSHFGRGTWLFGDPATPEELRRWIRTIAAAGADTYVPDVYYTGTATWYRSERAPRPQYQLQRFAPMMDAGTIPLEVFVDEAHKQGMELFAGFRMNDRHKVHRPFFDDHPNWLLKALGNGADYSLPEVRDWMFSVIEEVVNRFDVDGVELNFIRHGYCFPPETAREQHPVMTGFLRRVRKMLDEVGEKRGRRLVLGVRVFQSLDQCRDLGFDLRTWIDDKLVDYVAPTAHHNTDFNAEYDEFAALTRDSDCGLYPGLAGDIPEGATVMSLDNLRAAVQNFYGAGADGLSTFNYDVYMWGQLRSKSYPGPVDNYPKALEYFKILRDPQAVAAGDRHYLFLPLWPEDVYGPGVHYRHLPIPHVRAVLKRGEPNRRATYRFRICENLPKQIKLRTDKRGRYAGTFNKVGKVPGAWLVFRAIGMEPGDEIAVDINGKEVPADRIRHIWHQEGRPAWEGRPLPPYTECRLPLTAPPGVNGDNELGLKLLKSAAGTKGDIVVDELEVIVNVKD